MTSQSALRRLGVPVISAAATALAMTVGLSIQHARSGWPFDGLRSASATERAAGTGGIDVPERSSDRVPVEALAGHFPDVRLETVGRESLAQSVRAVATIVPDESRISHVHTRVAGWLEQLDVATTGEVVRAGQPLARIFSQELMSSQTEYLAARRNTQALGITSAVLASGRTRLTVLGMTPAEIDAIERSGEPRRLVTVTAPRSGVVVNRGVTAGTAIDPSTTLLTIADLSRVWVLAEIPEASIPAVRLGSVAQLDFPASGRPPFAARVEFVYPTLTERTRTLRVRLSVPNPGGILRPGLYGSALFEVAGPPVMTVPRDAVVDTGLQRHVFVATGTQFVPRPVTVGVQLADRIEITEGLQAGEQVVAAGVFLLDSESRLRATGGGGGHHHGASPEQTMPFEPAADPHAGHAMPPAAQSDPHAGHAMPAAPKPDPHAGHRERQP